MLLQGGNKPKKRLKQGTLPKTKPTGKTLWFTPGILFWGII
jgi:hypothetical protein